MNPAHSELDQLARFQARADKIASDAARWPALLSQARANLAAAQEAFVSGLDAKAAASVADADAQVRALVPACAALDAAGGPEALRFNALNTPDVFAAFVAGFEKRYNALEKLKPLARAAYSQCTADAVAAGADPRHLVGFEMPPSMREARSVLDVLDGDAQAALVAHNYAANPAGYSRRPFGELFALLAAPLPTVPAVSAA